MNKHYRLYMDEPFPGDFSFDNPQPRKDGMNCYCFAGVLIAEENIEPIRWAYKEFIAKWGIDYPLHYVNIRGKRGNFDWLGLSGDNLRDGKKFVDEYHDFMFSMPFEVYGCAVDRIDYENTYNHYTHDALRNEIKGIAFRQTIVNATIAAKKLNFVMSVHAEEAGLKEDNRMRGYLQLFKSVGHPVAYKRGLNALHEFYYLSDTSRQTAIPEPLLTEPKANPFIQIADFCAFVIAKAAYDKN